MNRRTVLKMAPAALPLGRVLGANDRINVSVIGTKGMGLGHVRMLAEMSAQNRGVQLVAASDIFTGAKRLAQETGKLQSRDIHHDYHDLLARPDVDAVFVATPDHWHARMALDALAAGKDLYLQKPMTHTVEEARQVTEAAAKSKQVLQVGSQHVSDPRFFKVKELIEEGVIGPLLFAQTTYSRYSTEGMWNKRKDPEVTAKNIDWQRWLGSAPSRPFSAERYSTWRKYWDYSGGIATDLFFHVLAPYVFALKAGFPSRVTASGGIYTVKDREVPDTYATMIEYPSFFINIAATMGNATPMQYIGNVIYGHKGTIVIEQDKVSVIPVQGKVAKTDTGAKVYPFEPVVISTLHRPHVEDFLQSVRSRKQPRLDASLGFQITAAVQLGVQSYRKGKMMFFDAATRRVVESLPPRPEYQGVIGG